MDGEWTFPSSHTGRPLDTIMIITALVLSSIVVFAWRDATEAAFENYYPDDAHAFKARMIYASIATIVAIVIIVMMTSARKK